MVQTYTNPDPRKKWVIKVAVQNPVSISLKFIPDKFMASHEDLQNCIMSIVNKGYDTPEDLVLSIMEAINNELIPDWLEVIYEKDGLTIQAEDRQPGKENTEYPSTQI
ncbi:hypothetical protein [Pseudemcibacter aquimaris]|uniref:hypothetical protein n=1 Tax=Pseudemcibacter aquimaris TaxID=2857064 RepID=UPI002011AE93|nr:hypothetical protein [Pseudemcibacter aquimaris]MCC3862216.1 hypothetical protein [Pseudemcibacter aquimaris]WDU58970.1 hypothetical protein KW060_01605 [Pseudemcibacter aquimaris]